MRANLGMWIAVASVVGASSAGLLACGGATFVPIGADAGADGGSGSGGSSGGSGSSSGAGSGGSSGSSGGLSGGSSSSGGSSGSSSSGGSSGGSSSSSGGSSGGSSGSSSGGTATCPSNPPTGGAQCPKIGLKCEYGTNPNPACNQVETCEPSGWSIPAPGQCEQGTCPARYIDVPQNKSCSPLGLDCSYAEGQCNCAQALPVGGATPIWQCAYPGKGCSEPRPRIGSACSQPGLACDYGACTGGVNLVCTGGAWVEQQTPCPAVSAR